jgi:hypothetical protein
MPTSPAGCHPPFLVGRHRELRRRSLSFRQRLAIRHNGRQQGGGNDVAIWPQRALHIYPTTIRPALELGERQLNRHGWDR